MEETHRKFSWQLCFKTRFLTVLNGNNGLVLEWAGVDGVVVSYSMAMRLNLRLRRVFGL